MGQRANLVVVVRGKRTLYYDHWCANRLDVELFWGPRLALDFVAQLGPVAEPDGWLDTRWCEGAVVLDFDRSVLTWFGGEDMIYDVPLRRAHHELMSQQWRGWEIRWAYEGILSIADELALPREQFRARPEDSARPHDDTPRPLTFNQSFPEDNLTATSVRLDDGTLLVGRLCGDDDALRVGPALIDVLIANGSIEPLRWEGEFPQGGVHVDCARRRLDTWWAPTTLDLVECTGAAWPGWTVRWHRDRYEHQLELVDGRFVLPVAGDLPMRIVRSLEAHVHRDARNPVRELLPVLAANGSKVDHINPATDVARGSVGDLEEKRALLASLARSFTSTT